MFRSIQLCSVGLVALLFGCGGGSNTPSSNANSQTSSSASNFSSSSVASSSVTSQSSSSSSSTVSNGSETLVLAMNAGYFSTSTIGGIEFMGDKHGTGGSAHPTEDAIAGTAMESLYQTEVYGENITYNIPVSNATYRVVLHFVEMFHEANGQRIFSVSVEGDQGLSALDVFAEVGHDYAFDYEFDAVDVSDETLTIALSAAQDNATLSGITVYSSNGGEYVPPPIPDYTGPGGSAPGLPDADCWIDLSTISRNPADYPVVRELPNPFVFNDGRPVVTREDWACRRQEISSMVQAIQFGPVPPAPDNVSATLSGSSLTVNVTRNGRSMQVKATVTKPSGAGPFPAVVSTLGARSASELNSMGIAHIDYDLNSVTPWDFGTNGSYTGPFYNLYPESPHSGKFMAWGWGVSRIIDALEQNPSWGIDASRVGTTGFSFQGKTSFVAAVFDDRVAIGMPISGGHGGVAAWRVAEDNDNKSVTNNGCCETILEIGGAPAWFTDGFTANWRGDNTYRLPFDAHMIVALMAPRAFITAEGWDDVRNGSAMSVGSAYKAVWAAREVYKFLGAEDFAGFVTGPRGHSSMTSQESGPLNEFIRGILFNQPTPAPFHSGGSAPNVSWQTPTPDPAP